MGDNHARDVSQYKYSAMSNLVLQADRRFVTRRTDEATGDPESLAGRLRIGDMGANVGRGAAPKPKKGPQVERGSAQEGQDILAREQRKRKAEQTRGVGILGQSDLLVEGLRYRPRTPATRATFELILNVVATNLGDVSHEIVLSAADAVLEYLKDEDMKDFDKKKEVDDLLGATLNPKQFNEVVNLGKKITDYDAQDDDEMDTGAGAGEDDADIDDRQGVAVVFDDDDEDEDAAILNEVRDESTDDEAGPEDDEEELSGAQDRALTGEADVEGRIVDGDEMVLDSGPSVSKTSEESKGKNYIPARDIDAYWLQREIGKLYPDAHIQHDKTTQALHMLSGEPDEPGGEEKQLREIENDLMELFDYEHHEVVQKLIENREKVIWLTRLARAENDEERGVVEREMASEGARWILDELRGKKATAGQKKIEIKMDIDKDSSLAETAAPKTGQAEGGLVGGLQPKKLINLENLIFEQGNHLMTNPKVRLPEGSTKRTFKGYEGNPCTPAEEEKRSL
ncbi:hypothetical protein PG994_010887 [Apiospora phragmitis]|uniref:Brr2 N-terminal helicase PWI domain-containing protein n=1 Tax=Apiospora phragmitis TaxID=2905665 RepID=A0ABR1TRC7_9PEZI